MFLLNQYVPEVKQTFLVHLHQLWIYSQGQTFAKKVILKPWITAKAWPYLN